MNILLLGPYRENIINFLESYGDIVINKEEKINKNMLNNIDFIISYGYRYIINEEIVDKYKNKIINLHISYLPWNRGADPNLWSFLSDTPKGVSIHYIDKGLDTGAIIAKRKVEYMKNDTLRTSYERLCENIEELLKENWPTIRCGWNKSYMQINNGSTHKLKDKDKYMYLLYKGWDTPVEHIIGKALSKNKE